MPANLTPQYIEAEKKYREAKEIPDKIAALEEMLTVIPKHKGTDRLRGDLKSKLAKLKTEAQRKKGTKQRTVGYRVDPEGAGQVVLVGSPNAGKSALVARLTKAAPEVADYPFTTRVPTPGMMTFEDIAVQLVDLPPLSEGYVEPWVFDIIRRADAVLLVLDLSADPLAQFEALEALLRASKIGIEGGAPVPADQFGWLTKPALVAATKCDEPGAADTLEIWRELMPFALPVVAASVESGEGLPELGRAIYDALGILRVYTKAPGKEADRKSPFVMPLGSTLEDLAERIHKDFLAKMRYARAWGGEALQGQMVQRDYVLREGDVIEFHIDQRLDGGTA